MLLLQGRMGKGRFPERTMMLSNTFQGWLQYATGPPMAATRSSISAVKMVFSTRSAEVLGAAGRLAAAGGTLAQHPTLDLHCRMQPHAQRCPCRAARACFLQVLVPGAVRRLQRPKQRERQAVGEDEQDDGQLKVRVRRQRDRPALHRGVVLCRGRGRRGAGCRGLLQCSHALGTVQQRRLSGRGGGRFHAGRDIDAAQYIQGRAQQAPGLGHTLDCANCSGTQRPPHWPRAR